MGWRFGFSPWLPVTLSLSLPTCKMGDNTTPLVACQLVQLPAVVGRLGTPNGSRPAVSSLISRPVFLRPSSPPRLSPLKSSQPLCFKLGQTPAHPRSPELPLSWRQMGQVSSPHQRPGGWHPSTHFS